MTHPLVSAPDGMHARSRETLTLLGTALGDALGLPYEGLSAKRISRHTIDSSRFRLFGHTGWVSDDTEQSALAALSLLRAERDPLVFIKSFRRSLVGWFLRLPWGIGLATLRACVRIALGFRRSGVPSAGNGAAMRAAIVGVFLRDESEERKRWSDALATVTHTDPRAVCGARYVAEVAARCAKGNDVDPRAVCEASLGVVDVPSLRDAIERALKLGTDARTAGEALGNTGFVMHCVPLAAWAFAHFGRDTVGAVTKTITAGGDTDSNAAIVGAWCGARGNSLPEALIEKLSGGPFGREHLIALGEALDARHRGEKVDLRQCGFSVVGALARNLALYPVIVGHGVARLVP